MWERAHFQTVSTELCLDDIIETYWKSIGSHVVENRLKADCPLCKTKSDILITTALKSLF